MYLFVVALAAMQGIAMSMEEYAKVLVLITTIRVMMESPLKRCPVAGVNYFFVG